MENLPGSQFPKMNRAPKWMLGTMLPLPIAWHRTCTSPDYDLGRRMDVPVLLHACHPHRAASSGGRVNLGDGGFWGCIYIVILTLEFKTIQSQVWNKLLFKDILHTRGFIWKTEEWAKRVLTTACHSTSCFGNFPVTLQLSLKKYWEVFLINSLWNETLKVPEKVVCM